MANFVRWTPKVYEEFCNSTILKPREKKVMHLHVFTDKTYDQMADELGYSPETIKSDIRKCKDKYIQASEDNPILKSAIYK